jgi:cytochrome c-type biogenesis protein CcmH/NrfG
MWCSQAAAHGDPDAIMILGVEAYEQGDTAAAQSWYRRLVGELDGDTVRELIEGFEADGQLAVGQWLREGGDARP